MSFSYDSCANGAISVDGVPELLARIHGPSSDARPPPVHSFNTHSEGSTIPIVTSGMLVLTSGLYRGW